jgi:hypothetical protein
MLRCVFLYIYIYLPNFCFPLLPVPQSISCHSGKQVCMYLTMEQLFTGAQKLWLAHTGRYMSSFYNGNELCETIHYNAPKALVTLSSKEMWIFFLSKERDGIVPGQQLNHEFEFLSLVTGEKQWEILLERLRIVIDYNGWLERNFVLFSLRQIAPRLWIYITLESLIWL